MSTINNSKSSSSPTEQRTRSILSSSTESSTGTFFQDSGIKYVVHNDEESSIIINPINKSKAVLSSTESSTGTFFEDSGVKYVVLCDDKGSFKPDSFNSTRSVISSTLFDTESSSIFDPLSEINSSTRTYFEESSPTKCSSTFNFPQDITSSFPEEEVRLSENYSF